MEVIEQKEMSAAGKIGCFFLAFGFLLFIGWAESTLDSSGFIPHTRETYISASASWIVGESKTCYSTPLDEDGARVNHRKTSDVTLQVRCDDGPGHRIEVKFWGLTERKDSRARYNDVAWNCTRVPDSFTCKALN